MPHGKKNGQPNRFNVTITRVPNTLNGGNKKEMCAIGELLQGLPTTYGVEVAVTGGANTKEPLVMMHKDEVSLEGIRGGQLEK